MAASSLTAERLAPPAAQPLNSHAWLVLAVVLTADVLDLLDGTITNLAAPSIVRDLGGGEALIKWLGAAYALALGTALVLGGRLGDRFGKRRMFLVGIVGFTLASVGCGLSTNPTMIIVSRSLQGALGAMMIPQGFGMLMRAFPREQMGKAFSAFGPIMGLAAVGGPILAGFLIEANLFGLGWRPLFLINIILGCACLVAAIFWLPDDRGDPETVVDITGSTLLAGAMFGLLYGLIEGSSVGWTMLPLTMVGMSLVLFAAFAWRQATAANPLLQPSLLRNRGFIAGLVLGLVFFASVNGLAYVLALFMQNILSRSPMSASLGLAPMCVGIVIASVCSAPLIAKLGRRLVIVGLLITMGGTGLLLALVLGTNAAPAALPLAIAVFVIGLGMGTCFGTIFDIALGDATPSEAGSASGALSAIQQLASGIGSAAVTSVYFHGLASGGGARAMSSSLILVVVVLALCCVLVWRLPRHTNPQAGHGHG